VDGSHFVVQSAVCSRLACICRSVERDTLGKSRRLLHAGHLGRACAVGPTGVRRRTRQPAGCGPCVKFWRAAEV
jgi:hypothetical protein